jgi:TM2 domain-containing membrane protein YozV
MSTPSGLNLGGSTYVPSSKSTFAAQPIPRNAALAFLLSLLLPGLGQFYCRKNSRGAWTMIFFLISLGVTIWLTPMLVGESGIALIWGVLLRIAVFLYGFAFLDAYFTAREMTAGTDPFIAESPRIAAILNLLTRGFGYFYLGERAAGFAVFIGLGIFQQVIVHSLSAGNEAVAPLLLELILGALGVHAYEIARKREKEILATIEPAPQLPAQSSLPPAVPVGLAILLAAAYVCFCCIGLFMPNYSAIDQSNARISQGTQETVYSNPTYGIEFKVPAGWSLKDQDTKFPVSGSRDDNVCAADLRLVAWSPLLPADSYAHAISAQLERPENKANRLVQNTPATLAGLPARDIVIAIEQQGSHITEHQIAARKGMTLYILTTDSLTESIADCQPDLQYIQQHLGLPK